MGTPHEKCEPTPAESTSQTSINLGDQDNSHFRVQLWTSGGHLKWELDIRNGNRHRAAGGGSSCRDAAKTDRKRRATLTRRRRVVLGLSIFAASMGGCRTSQPGQRGCGGGNSSCR